MQSTEKAGIHFTGHTMEWLSIALPPSRLSKDWVLDAVNYLILAIESEYGAEATRGFAPSPERLYEYGNLLHALHGIRSFRYSRWK
jgi:hypothetical protein